MSLFDTIWAIFDSFKVVIGVDPGSDHLRIIKGGEVIFDEKSQIIIDKSADNLIGFGDSTVSGKSTVIKPVDYVITDFFAFDMLLRASIKKGANSKSLLSKSRKMYLSIPTGSTEIEKRAFRDAAEHANVTDLYMIYQSYCSAIAMDLLSNQKHFIVIDFSHSKVEMAVFANGGIISTGTVRIGTARISQLLKNFFRRKHKLEASDRDIDFLFTELKNPIDEIKIQFTSIKVAEIQAVINNVFAIVNDELVAAMERVSNHPDIGKVITAGIYFTGGGSTIDFLRDQIKIDDRLKRTVSKTPLVDNINGLKKIMEDRNRFEGYIMT